MRYLELKTSKRLRKPFYQTVVCRIGNEASVLNTDVMLSVMMMMTSLQGTVEIKFVRTHFNTFGSLNRLWPCAALDGHNFKEQCAKVCTEITSVLS
ncbi:hypothetical protein CRM22_009129 [Opisthorchis felineus]|uniref:Uncharacterized protein n=1 Tax=Opisthorchis felineus TaxID=147828 RepID=A0A4S2L8W3_OPIFE|nr:hypothetical protein CRM22_009129 [Opisthorchis felineus]